MVQSKAELTDLGVDTSRMHVPPAAPEAAAAEDAAPAEEAVPMAVKKTLIHLRFLALEGDGSVRGDWGHTSTMEVDKVVAAYPNERRVTLLHVVAHQLEMSDQESLPLNAGISNALILSKTDGDEDESLPIVVRFFKNNGTNQLKLSKTRDTTLQEHSRIEGGADTWWHV